ncbi:MAG: hypothetical protein ACE5E4_06485 [Candidatus Binatia bacterium]
MTSGRKSERKTWLQGAVVGLVAGLVLGAAGLSAAALGKKGWERFGPMFQQGYIAGFNDCVQLAKGMDSDGWVASNFIVPSRAKPMHWIDFIQEIYAKPENAGWPVSRAMMLAGARMLKDFGPAFQGGSMGLEGMRRLIENRHRAIMEAAKARALAKKSAADGAESKDAEPSEKTPGAGSSPGSDSEPDKAGGE